MNESELRSSRAPGRLLAGATASVLFVFGLALCLYHGRVGLMPLDQSIVFDGGWRILCGQVPFRDFTTPAGLVPIALQAAFFRAFGVTWFVYCLHAAVLNGLFCILVLHLLRRLGAGKLAAAFYGLLSGVVFYPPFGVPYPDQHAFFFSLAAVVALVEAGVSERGRGAALSLAAAPWLLAAAYLSKPIPSVFFLPLVGLPFLPDPSRLRSAVRPFLTSCAMLAACLAGGVLCVDRGLLLESLFTRPGHEGRGRVLSLLDPAALAGQATELLRAGAMPSLLLTILSAGVLLALRPAPRSAPGSGRRAWMRPTLALYLLVACAAFVMATDNQGENGIPFVFVAAGLVHGEVIGRWRVPRGPAAWLVAALAATSAVDAVRFERRVNETRMVHELDGVASASPDEARTLPPALRFLEWRLHPFYRFRPGDLAAVVSFLRKEDGPIYVFGDLTILYTLSGRPSAGQALWLHPGLTLPEPHEAAFADWEERLLDDLERRHVRFLVRESRQTYNGLRLSDLPRLAARIEARRVRRLSFGPIDVIELDRGPDAQP